MAKIIKIEKCTDCKWWDWGWCYHPDIETSERDAREITDTDIDEIPLWCPLDDIPMLCACKTVPTDMCPNCGKPLMCGQDGLPFCFNCGYAGEEKKHETNTGKISYCF